MTVQAGTAFMTDVGRAADENSYLSGQRLELTEFVFGASSRTISGSETFVSEEVWRGSINRIAPTGTIGQFVVEVIVPADAGPFTIREGGVLNSAGQLIAIAKYSRLDKVPAEGSQVNEAYLGLVITLDHPDNLILKIDPTTVTASRSYVEDVLMERDMAIASAHLMAANNLVRADLQATQNASVDTLIDRIRARLINVENYQSTISDRASRAILT